MVTEVGVVRVFPVSTVGVGLLEVGEVERSVGVDEQAVGAAVAMRPISARTSLHADS